MIKSEYCPDKENIISDPLSRQTTNGYEEFEVRDKSIVIYHLAEGLTKICIKKFSELKNTQKDDHKLRRIIINVTNIDNYLYSEEFLFKRCIFQWRICLPAGLAKDLILECHMVYRHVCVKEYQAMINEDFHFTNSYQLIRITIRSSYTCQRNKTTTSHNQC